jgi:hypothetical protein
VSNGRVTLSLIDDLWRAVDQGAAIDPEQFWEHVLRLESSVLTDGDRASNERELVGKVKAGASFVIEARHGGHEPPYKLIEEPLAKLERVVKMRMIDGGRDHPG